MSLATAKAVFKKIELYYFVLFYVLRNARIKLIKKDMIGASAAGDAGLVMTVLQSLNTKFMLDHVLLKDGYYCDACTSDKRQGIWIVSIILIALFNMYVFRQGNRRRISVANKRASQVLVLCYVIVSIGLFCL